MKAGAGAWVLLATIVGSSMSFIDGTAVNVALPVIARELGANAAQLQWIIEGYALFLSALILLGGALGDRYGRRSVFVAGIALFALASLACAFAPNPDLLVAARCVQGIGGALATPGSLALITAHFEGEARGKAIGLWSAASAVTSAGGPVLGGWLAQSFSWRAVFLINLPLAIVVVAVSLACVTESRDEDAPKRLDLTGATLATAGLGALVYGLIRLQGGSASAPGLIAVLAGIVLLAVFVVVERRERAPMIRLDLFRSRVFTATNIYTLFLYAALGGSLYFLPFTLQDVQQYSPVAAGAALLPMIALMSIFSRWSGALATRIGARIPLVVGALVAGCGFALLAVPGIGASYWTSYFPAALVLGAGLVFFVAPLTTAVMDAVAPAHAGLASGINNAIARTAGLIAIALLGIVLVGVFDRQLDGQLARASVAAQTREVVDRERGRLAGGTVPSDVAARDRPAVETAMRRAYINGFRTLMLASTGLCVAAALVAAVMLPNRSALQPAGTTTATETRSPAAAVT